MKSKDASGITLLCMH